jgi:hypothetical protein
LGEESLFVADLKNDDKKANKSKQQRMPGKKAVEEHEAARPGDKTENR